MIRSSEKIRTEIYKYFVGSNRMNFWREGIPYMELYIPYRVGPEFLKAIDFREVLLEFCRTYGR